jgi:hypothetical protein
MDSTAAAAIAFSSRTTGIINIGVRVAVKMTVRKVCSGSSSS